MGVVAVVCGENPERENVNKSAFKLLSQKKKLVLVAYAQNAGANRTPQRGSMASLRTSPMTSPLRGRAAGIAVCTPCGIRPADMGPGGLATPNRAGVCGRPPTNRSLLAVREDGGVYIVLVLGVGRCAPSAHPCRVCF